MIFIVILALVLLVIELYPDTGRDIANFKGRAVSLKIFQQKLKECLNVGSLPNSLYHLCGLKEISGYVVDKANRDVLLIGKVDRSSPPLYLDDFVVALRIAFGKYGGQTPGCSIDHDAGVLRQLDNIRRRLAARILPAEREQLIKQWETVCASSQRVSVSGVPFYTRFAQVMVRADYELKRVADGSDELNLAFFSSVSDIILSEAASNMRKGRYYPVPAVFNRFWFAPGENSYTETHNAVFLSHCEVKLRTAEQYLNSKGKAAHRLYVNSYARQFAEDFSNFYPDIAAQRPIFRELQNLYRFVALAHIIKYKAPHKRVGLNLDYLLERYPVSKESVQKYLPGRPFFKKAVKKLRTSRGSRSYELKLPCCGGISMDFNVRRFFKKDRSGRLATLKENAFNQRFSTKLLFYNIDAIPKNVYVSNKTNKKVFKPKKPGFSDIFPKTDSGFWDFISYAQDNWVYEWDRDGELCQDPQVSYERLKGDCDDFAVMLAYYTQKYWGYDSYIVLIHIDRGNQQVVGHFVAYAQVDAAVKNSLEKSCNKAYPYLKKGNLYYIPLDWMICPDWMWVNTETRVKTFEWYELAGKPV